MSTRSATDVRRSDLLSGLGDAGFASLGTFLAGVVAVRELPAASLALYVVLSSATIFSMPLPRQLAYFPSLIGANLQPNRVVPVVRNSVRNALRPSLLASLVVIVSGISLLRTVDLVPLATLTLTATLFGVLSPLQDFVRGSLHLVGRHARAAVCSVVLAVSTGAMAALTIAVPLSPDLAALLPFGSLVVGNSVSLAVGFMLLKGAPRHDAYDRAALIERSRYLIIELVVQGCWFACNYGVLLLLGARALASLETARLSASPVLILAAGVSTFMLAAVLRQISSRPQDGTRARTLLIRSFAVVLIGGALWAAALTLALPMIERLLNRPVDLALALGRAAAFGLEACAGLTSSVLIAIGASKAAVRTSVTAGAIGLVGTVVLAPVLGPIALPMAQGAGSATRLGVALTVSRDRLS